MLPIVQSAAPSSEAKVGLAVWYSSVPCRNDKTLTGQGVLVLRIDIWWTCLGEVVRVWLGNFRKVFVHPLVVQHKSAEASGSR